MGLPTYYFLTLTAINILMAWSLYVPYRARRLHFLTVVNMAISAYLSGYAAIAWDLSFWILLPAGALVGALTSLIVAPAIGDAPPFTVAVVGLAAIALVKVLIENSALLGGTIGLFGIPPVTGSPRGARTVTLSVAWTLVALTGWGLSRFERSRYGLAASIAFADRTLAETNGIDVYRLNVAVQTTGSAIAGAAGVLYAFTMRGLFPDFFTYRYLGILMTFLFVGGYTTPWGVVIATPILWGLPLVLPEELQSQRIIIYAAILVTVILVRPQGLINRRTLARLRRRRVQHDSSE